MTPDAGLQRERTALAWTRTALSQLAVALAAARLLTLRLPLPAVIVALALAALLAAVQVHASSRRYRLSAQSLVGSHADGRLPALAAAHGVIIGLAALAYIAFR